MIAYMNKYEHINFIYVFIWKYMGLHILQTNSYIVIYGGICDLIFEKGVHIWTCMEVYANPYSQKMDIYEQIWNYMEFRMQKGIIHEHAFTERILCMLLMNFFIESMKCHWNSSSKTFH